MRRVKGFGRGRSEVWVWQVKGLGVAGQGFGSGRSRVFAWQVWGLEVAGQGLRVWQVKGLGVAGEGFGCGRSREGQALTFPSNMASEEPGRETSQS